DKGVPPSEYEPFRARLIEQLLAIRDPLSGGPYVKAVLKREDAFPGAHSDKAPDLTLVLCDYGFVSVMNVEPAIWVRSVTKGIHYPEGIFLARGPGIPKGQTVAGQSILDMAPTLLYSLGLPVPEDLEGRVMEAVFESTLLTSQPVKFGPPTEPPNTYANRGASLPRDADEEMVVLNRLRALGYVE